MVVLPTLQWYYSEVQLSTMDKCLNVTDKTNPISLVTDKREGIKFHFYADETKFMCTCLRRMPLLPSKHFWVLQTFDRKCLAMVKNDEYENHL